ncbi:MAG: hypothetical protein M3R58_16280 [Pseudomonadota bacterium]|nr:hypothetical protein [Pseudomonadota bacterium]
MDRAVAWRAGTLALALLLAWRVITVNAVLFGDDGRPKWPDAAIRAAPDRGALAAVLRENPGEVAALLVFAQQLERAGDASGAAKAYESALAVAPVDRDALQLSAGFFLRQGRTKEAVQQLDRLAEHYSLYDSVFPALMQLLPVRDSGWEAILARNPAWLGAFIVTACRQLSVDPLMLAPLLQQRVAAGRVQAPEVECITDKLRSNGQWEAAYQVWLNTLPRERLAEVGHVFNGGFERPASGIGFDWQPSLGPDRQVGHAVEFAIASGGGGKRALRVTYNGKRQVAPAIRQFMAVGPGRYQFNGLARIDALNSVRGVQWALRCMARDGRSTLVAASERFLGSSEWRGFAFEAVVPEGCPGQVLQLEPVGMDEGTTFLAGTAWFDDLRLTRRR